MEAKELWVVPIKMCAKPWLIWPSCHLHDAMPAVDAGYTVLAASKHRITT